MNDSLKVAHLRDCQIVEHLLAVATQLSHLLNIFYVMVFASVFVFVFARCPADLGGVKADEHGSGALGDNYLFVEFVGDFLSNRN